MNQKLVHLPDEKPEMHFSRPKMSPIGLPPTMRCITKPPPGFIPQQKLQQMPSDDFFNRSPHQFGDQCNRNNPFMLGHNDITMSTTMPTELMNQFMNCSYQPNQQQQLQQPRCHPLNPFNDMLIQNQSFYERNLKFQQQQHLQSLKRDFYNSSGMSMGSSGSSSALSAYEANMQQQYSMMANPSTSYFNRFDPPKPDTPPSKPLWLDPVWNCDGNAFDNRNNGSNNSGSYGNSESVSEY